ncbi:HD-GYP domain-containing protein [[Clostridium] polysaccharolyticum]|uniref:HDIG domain-containing protein n=1 Tax=[Clostridium] polysaccharolyticum TaxID=29364 RepID=A0A1I0F3A5_9FIRM|nr:HD domain-containing phosphohydrolase [[Clostridium] polysaccharolyticum]SET52298.1 HDIG domain-containing protein [[Clostridium] polysaccharolyticum]
MKRKSINAVKGNEVLARDVYGNTDTILMVSGMTLKKEYIEKLKQLNIDYVYIEDGFSRESDEQKTIEERIKSQCQETIESVYERYSYCGDVELRELTSVASKVVFEVLKEPNVLYGVETVRQKHETIYTHSLNVCALSVLVALKLNLSKVQLDDIAIGSLLHDIGYMYLENINSWNSLMSYTEKDVAYIKKHVVFGYTDVENETWLSKKAKNIILSHHEFYDGSGYPLKMAYNEIDIETKVVTICNEFDRFIHGNTGSIMKSNEAVEYIISQSGKKFDPVVVSAFNSSVARFPNGINIITNQKDIGVVVRQNPDFPMRPVIKIVKDSSGKVIAPPLERDLVKELSLFIEEMSE